MRSGFHLRDLSLRVRLLVALVVLAAIGLAVLDFVSYRALHSYLYDRVDQQLESAVGGVTIELAKEWETGNRGELLPQDGRGPRGGGPGDGGGPGGSPSVTFGQLRYEGSVLVSKSFSFPEENEVPKPALPRHLEASEQGAAEPFTTGERGGGSESFRVLAATSPVLAGVTTVVAIPLGDTQATLDRLALIELVVSAVILVVLAGAAWWLVGVGLRPLREMGATAGDIAAGDLSRRVEPANPKTEVGRLGLALNAMLAQIESAFAKREAAEARLRQFLADASHELRTPLAAIRGYAELHRIGANREPEQVDRAMERIEAESERMGGLVDDLLTLARVDEVREPVRERVALEGLLADACQDARAAAHDRAITLAAPEPLAVEADPDQLRRVVANLLRNAVVHTPAGTPIEISLAREGGEAVVRVRDHGPGLPPGEAEAVFERFWRNSASRGRDDGGAGLGLAIVAALVSANRGSVEASNAEGGGALFTVRLPTA